MARIRSIHPDACDSEKLAGASDAAERLFWRLQTHCDDEGRCEDNPRLIHARCCPLVPEWDAERVGALLGELAAAGLLVRYSAGRPLIQITNWGAYQHPQRPKRSKWPGPHITDLDPSLKGTGDVRDEYATHPGGVLSGGEGSGEGDSLAIQADDGSRTVSVDNLAAIRAIRGATA